MITYTKLRDGSWGIRSTLLVKPGDTVSVVKKSGEIKTEQVRRVIWSGNGVWLASIATSSAPRRRSRRWESEDHEDCLSFGPCGPHCEYAHVFRR